MNCVDTKELERFIAGKLAPDRLVEIDEHIGTCSECKASVGELAARGRAFSELGTELLGLRDCPDYDELSAYIANSLDAERSKALCAHANLCELCAHDIERIRELRSHAALREKVVVRPGMSRRTERRAQPMWRRVLAGATVATVVVAVAFMAGNLWGPPKTTTSVVVKPPDAVKRQPAAPKPEVARKSIKTGGESVAQVPAPETTARPKLTYTTVLKDGPYQVIKRNGKLVFAKRDGMPVHGSLSKKIAEKIATGKTSPASSLVLALGAIGMRDGETYAAPTAPKPVAPVGKVMLSDRPMFIWSKVDLAESYQITLTDKAGNIVIEEMTDKTTFTPSKPLERGRLYRWQVAVRFSESDSWAKSRAAAFKVLSTEDCAAIRKIERRLPGSHLALGAAYESFGLYDEAANEYRALRRANPNSMLAGMFLKRAVEAGR